MTSRISAVLTFLFLIPPAILPAQDSKQSPVPEVSLPEVTLDGTEAEAGAVINAEAPVPVTVSPVPAAAEAALAPPLPEDGQVPAANPVAGTGIDTGTGTDAEDTEAQRSGSEGFLQTAEEASPRAAEFLRGGGPSIWAIAALSLVTMALILWKIWRLALIGAWSRGKAGQAVAAYEQGDAAQALSIVEGRRGIRSKVVAAALSSAAEMPEVRAREETARVAKLHLGNAATGLGALELIATIAPLLGLLGTVLGMIAAFQALQAAGSKADPALLAGGIWEALLTTAAGMAVAIPASAALTWFEAVIGRIRRDIEDSATRIFVAQPPQALKLAAE